MSQRPVKVQRQAVDFRNTARLAAEALGVVAPRGGRSPLRSREQHFIADTPTRHCLGQDHAFVARPGIPVQIEARCDS